jgi:hypothetical protein
MDVYRPLRGGLFIYEVARLCLLAGVMGGAAPGGEEALFPVLATGAANALFLLMALFIWLDLGRYKAYIPLYTAGKALTVIAALGWCFFSRQKIFAAVLANTPGVLVMLGSLLCTTLGDILSVCGGAVLLVRLNREEETYPSQHSLIC